MIVTGGETDWETLHTIITVHWDCFENAARRGNVKILEYLLQKKKGQQEKTDNVAKFQFPEGVDVYKLLRIACEYGHVNVAEMLIQQGANVDVHAITPLLHIACYHFKDNHEMVKFLVEKGAYVNACDEKGQKPKGTVKQSAKILLERGAVVHTADKWLERAVTLPEDDAELVGMIIQRLDQVYSQNEGKNVLMAAASSANEKIVQVLIGNGFRVRLFINLYNMTH